MSILTKIKEAFGGQKQDFKALINEGAVVVDVRNPGEFKNNHAEGSINIPLGNFSQEMEQLAGKKVILVCVSGMRAGRAKTMLESCGVEAYNAGPWQKIKNLK